MAKACRCSTAPSRGDLLATIHVHTPEHLSREERELFEKLAELEKKNPKSWFDKFKEFFHP